MNGFCSHCHLEGTVWRYRIWTVGLRFMDRECSDRLAAMGLVIDPVTIADPRQTPRTAQRWLAGIRWSHA